MAGAALAALATTWLIAQPVIPTTMSGNECWNAGQGPGGPSTGFVCAYMTRNSTGYKLLGASTSGTINNDQTVNQVLISVQPTGGTTINTPVPAFDGALFSVCNVSNAALTGQTVTLAASTGSTLATGVVTVLTTLAARTCEELQYTAAATTWYQIR
jgi:hypothetical protein